MRIAVFGLGSIGRRHVNNLLALGETDVLVCDPRIGAEGFTGPIGIQSTTAPAHVWAWQPEAVVICTPPVTHHALAREAVTRRIKCFIEKPMTLTATEARDLIRLNDNRAVLAVGYQLLACESVRQFGRGWDRLAIWDKQNMTRWPIATYPRDLVLEYSHELALALYWAGSMPEKVCILQRPNPMNCSIALQWKDGRTVSLYLSANFYGYARGAISNLVDTWEFTPEANDAAYVAELEAFLAGAPYCTGEDGLAVMELIERLR
jgi:predicted dehydrogenase